MSSAEIAAGTREAFRSRAGDERLTSPMISDALDAIGLRAQVVAADLLPLLPGTRAFGVAATVQFAPTCEDPDDPYADAISFIDSLQAGELVVVATDNSHRSAFWGELFSAAALGHGVTGVITDGCLRDTPKIAGLNFPAFSRARQPADFRARMRVTGSRLPVVLGGVTIRPGDLVLADDDGVVVIPYDVAHDVLDRARARARAETTVLAELLAGETLRGVWDRHGIL
ncbi:hypothetical protein Lfu02_68830 [Longispora fulva]|uniref:Putative 4-hydroxy-4-methyl-2-oxoglutarate aldolase n=1 Tax=Longispora fulva TaxID=619741 RepID=A0A8J7GE96_9ACTN|nr:RraA family protein [Longispora fulva]MBG6134138.1 regulator of RNase E activity RraA [Longispora fulva]GIG62511.1 hypothetical protein Lfu02_68830 [Longispora fulva]